MAEDSGLTVAQKNETNKEIDIIRKAARGEISFFSRDVAMVVAKFGVGGGAGVVLGRYAGHHYFADDGLAEDNPDHDGYAVYKRAVAKIAVGAVIANLARRVSPVAAVGALVCTVGDAVADVIEEPVREQLDEWFADDEETTSTGSGTGTGAQGVYARQSVR